MNNSIRRTFTLFALIFTASISLVAQASPMPVPVSPLDAPPAITKVAPIAGATASYPNVLVWKNTVTPDKYTLKFKIAATGEIVNVRVPLGSCVEGGNCSVTLGATGILNHAKDGGLIYWRVIGKYGAEKSKSTQWMFVADTVNAPDTLMPADEAQLLHVHNLSWNANIANATYTVIVRDAATNALAFKHTLPAGSCAATCFVSPFATESLDMLTEYVWFVKVVGYNGSKAKSAKQVFITTEWPTAS